jgi:glycine cleavage system H protein
MGTENDLLFSKTNEWVKIEGEKAYIGITYYAQAHLGDIAFVEMPEIGAVIKAGGQLSILESTKSVDTVFSPVAGTVIEINEDLEDSPELLNEAPYEQHIAVVKISEPVAYSELLSLAEYEKLCEELS